MRARSRQTSICETCVLRAKVFNSAYVIYKLSKAQFMNANNEVLFMCYIIGRIERTCCAIESSRLSHELIERVP